MPSIQDLNSFKNAVNQLGDEPAVVESRDEVLEDIQPNEGADPLMPELSTMREIIGGETEADTEEAELSTRLDELNSDPEILEAQSDSGIVMDDDDEPKEESLYTVPREFEDLLGDQNDGQDVNNPDNDSEPDINQLLQSLEETEDELPVQELEAIEQEDFQTEEATAPPEVPLDVYKMLDTRFGELDSERFSSEPSGEGVPDTLAQTGLDQVEQSANDEALETPEYSTKETTNEPAPTAEPAYKTQGDIQEKPGDLGAEATTQIGSFDGGTEGEGSESGTVAKADRGSRDREPDELLAPNSENLSTLESVSQLEKALNQHRSIDLLNINEEEVEAKENEFEELEFRISHENAREFLLQLCAYPIALKLAIEEEIGENELREEAVETLIEMVSSGVNPRHVANYFFSQTGKRILLPKGQRYHAIDRDQINNLFYRQFVQLGIPLLRRAFFGISILALLLGLPFYFLYRPVQAYLYYQKGHSEILHDRFNDAERYFTLATNGWQLFGDSLFVKGWPYKSWYLLYAKAYTERKDFAEATFKLRETLRHYPNYRAAWFQYISLLSEQMGEFAKAEEAIQRYYNRFGRDYQSLIIRGQNYLYWGKIDPAYYEEARQVFAATYTLESKDDLPLLYLLDYYIRISPFSTHKNQLQKLTSFFMESNPRELEVPSKLYAQIMSETADYYLNRGKVEIAKKLLLNASQISSDSMEVYRSFAQYYARIGDRAKELEALNMSLFFLNYRDDRNTSPNLLENLALTEQRAKYISSSEQIFNASYVLNKLLRQVKEAEERQLPIEQLQMAEVYGMFGNFYYQNIPHALSAIPYYQKAGSMGFEDSYLRYRYGQQLYQQENFEHAVEQFRQSGLHLPDNYKVKYALGNSLLQIGNYNSAQGILEEVYSNIQEDLRRSFLLDPQNSQEARDRLFMLVRLANDLGVAYYRETLQSPKISNEEIALAYLMQAMGYLDILSREETVELKLPPELLFRPRLLTKKTIDLLENSIPAQGLVPGSLPDHNLKQILENKIGIPTFNLEVKPYWVDILDPNSLQETMDY